MSDSEVENNEAESRYQLLVDGYLAIADYAKGNGVISFTHTHVPHEIEGRGVASRLVRKALDDVRSQGLKAHPACSFVVDYFDRHPEVQDLRA